MEGRGEQEPGGHATGGLWTLQSVRLRHEVFIFELIFAILLDRVKNLRKRFEAEAAMRFHCPPAPFKVQQLASKPRAFTEHRAPAGDLVTPGRDQAVNLGATWGKQGARGESRVCVVVVIASGGGEW